MHAGQLLAHDGVVAGRVPSARGVAARPASASNAPWDEPSDPVAKRSFISVVRATRHPSWRSPTRLAAGMRASSKNTSLKWASPVIWRSGRIVMPGVRRSTMKHEMPLCFGTVGSVRKMPRPKSQ